VFINRDADVWIILFVDDRKLSVIQISQGPYIERVLTGRGWLNLNVSAARWIPI
jgi:hypothetical protein